MPETGKGVRYRGLDGSEERNATFQCSNQLMTSMPHSSFTAVSNVMNMTDHVVYEAGPTGFGLHRFSNVSGVTLTEVVNAFNG